MSKITVDPDDISCSCLNIMSNQLPEKMIDDIRSLATPSYRDVSEDLAEDMYTTDDVAEAFDSNHIKEWIMQMIEIERLTNLYRCGYFRIIKVNQEHSRKHKMEEEPHHV